jgi:rhodanese-related sulfurtransferase
MTYKTGKDLINEAKLRIQEVSVADVQQMQRDNTQAVYLDVREPNEWNLGHLPSALHIPRGQLEGKIEGLAERDKKIVVYCATGNRSSLAADTLKVMGYEAVSLAGGFKAWAQDGGEIDDGPSNAPAPSCAIS